MASEPLTHSVDDLVREPWTIFREAAELGEPVTITDGGEPTAVVQDIASYRAGREREALLAMLAQGRADESAGRVRPLRDVMDELIGSRR